MINYNSTYEEICHHVEQMKMLSLSQVEEKHVKKLLELNSFIETPEMKEMIAEELKNENWISDTKILIDTAKKRDIKNKAIQEHLEQCQNLMVYKILEKKCRLTTLEINYHNKEWIFNEINAKGEKSRWISQKLNKALGTSSIEKMFVKKCEKENNFQIDLNWLHLNRTLFFEDTLFESLNLNILKKNSFKI